ncbi:hypothetical protein M3P05_18260 [Sansalvadorimonas sp. 2012CJ34-2]|uniref:Uncharacterized protein n=1 Tax=Parendozoicomonas callyspongiae TaxID=2942213 RepID=A0ABT0PKE9_9GAMM|nr:hypothetical protein [Sansalvadorimonas sp. 2012CJ34-2]MCL6271865.1 hypothetical protein [Sansalvadorimonas sp. 2012CJ34-2]
MTLLALSHSSEAVLTRPKKSVTTPYKTAKAISSTRKDKLSPEEEDWSSFYTFLNSRDNCEEMKTKASQHDFDMVEVGLPESVPPDYYSLTVLHTQMSSFRAHLQDWLEEYGFERPPVMNGYENGKLPKNANSELRTYLNDRDPLLLITLSHLVHLVRVGDYNISAREIAYFELSLLWIEQILYPAGLNPFDWEKEYSDFLDKYHTYKFRQTFPSASSESELKHLTKTTAMTDDARKLLQEYLFIKEYPPFHEDNLELFTLWNAAVAIDDVCMQVSELDKTCDPLGKHHVLFTLKSALMGSYLDEAEQLLTIFWLKLSEIRSKRTTTWLREVLEYRPSGVPISNNEQNTSNAINWHIPTNQPVNPVSKAPPFQIPPPATAPYLAAKKHKKNKRKPKSILAGKKTVVSRTPSRVKGGYKGDLIALIGKKTPSTASTHSTSQTGSKQRPKTNPRPFHINRSITEKNFNPVNSMTFEQILSSLDPPATATNQLPKATKPISTTIHKHY